MEHTEFNRQIDKHKALLKRNYIICEIIGYLRLLFTLLTGATLSYVFFMSFRIVVIIAILAEVLAFSILWLCHDKLRGKINHSNEIIVIYNGHIYGLSSIWEAYPRVEKGSIETVYQRSEEHDVVVDMSFVQYMENLRKGQVATQDHNASAMYAKNKATKFFLM